MLQPRHDLFRMYPMLTSKTMWNTLRSVEPQHIGHKCIHTRLGRCWAGPAFMPIAINVFVLSPKAFRSQWRLGKYINTVSNAKRLLNVFLLASKKYEILIRGSDFGWKNVRLPAAPPLLTTKTALNTQYQSQIVAICHFVYSGERSKRNIAAVTCFKCNFNTTKSTYLTRAELVLPHKPL